MDIQITALRTVTSKEPVTVSLTGALQGKPQHAALLLSIRAEKDPAKQKQLKAALPVFTPAGTIEFSDSGKRMLTYSGYGQIDLDNLTEAGYDPQQVRDKLSELPYCRIRRTFSQG